ncbi:MAG: ribonuclease J, partial [Firmicutes bacterium]|nr:ribonuclease J [Bacillota bacterium]
KGVLVLLSDSTNAERPGFTPSERVVGETLGEIFRLAKQRVLVASFATNVHRIQQVITAAYEHDRQVAVVGRSMENVVEVALKLGYLSVPDGLLVEQEYLNRLPLNRVAILATGSQGEPMSALTRISLADHRKVEIVPGDTVIIAATPVPGNEKMVHRTVDNLYRRGANVFYEAGSGVHVSGHASQEELKLMLNFIRPRYFVPVHGEYRHLIHHSQLAQFMGLPRENILVGENGTVFEFTEEKGSLGGRVPAGNVLVDGLGVGDVGSVVLRDRKQLSQDGILVVVVAGCLPPERGNSGGPARPRTPRMKPPLSGLFPPARSSG